MRTNGKIDYVELPARNMKGSKAFFTKAFGWTFTDYGPDYSAFGDAGMDGGFYSSDQLVDVDMGSALVILYSDDLEGTLSKVERFGGQIKKPTFSFPGGRRFHFTDPSGNEFAVWSE